nr:MAG TPA: hypothetical protein [Caudoviricetes sp.]
MISMENIQAGIAKFIDREIAPSLSGWDKVLIAGAGGLLTARIPDIITQYADHPMLKALGVYDKEHGTVDVDALYNAAKPYIGADPMPIKIPVVKMTMKVGKKELDTLYRYIQESI